MKKIRIEEKIARAEEELCTKNWIKLEIGKYVDNVGIYKYIEEYFVQRGYSVGMGLENDICYAFIWKKEKQKNVDVEKKS